MKLRELIERLEEIEQELLDGMGEDVEPEVVCAIQPNYPLTVAVKGACVVDDEDTDKPLLCGANPIVWIATASGAPHGVNPYAPSEVWDAV